MKRQKMTVELARAISTDAGNRNMRKHGRSKWNREDVLVAARTFFEIRQDAAVLP